jgi:hypothetical protein
MPEVVDEAAPPHGAHGAADGSGVGVDVAEEQAEEVAAVLALRRTGPGLPCYAVCNTPRWYTGGGVCTARVMLRQVVHHTCATHCTAVCSARVMLRRRHLVSHTVRHWCIHRLCNAHTMSITPL